MQPITVLADEVLEQPAVLQLDEGHVSRCWYRLQGIDGPQVTLAPLRHQRPGTLRPSEVSDPSRGRDASAREDDEVLACADPVREGLCLFLDGGGGLLVLCLGDFGRGVGHLGMTAWAVREGGMVCLTWRERTPPHLGRRQGLCIDDVESIRCKHGYCRSPFTLQAATPPECEFHLACLPLVQYDG